MLLFTMVGAGQEERTMMEFAPVLGFPVEIT